MPHRPSARWMSWVLVALAWLALPAGLFAQAPPPAPPPPPPPLWAGSIGAGLSFTSGNTDTSTINVAYEVKRDGGLPVVFLSKGLYIRGETEDELTVDKALLENRVAYRLTPRLSVFDAYKNRPPNPAVEKNDVSFLLSVIFKLRSVR